MENIMGYKILFVLNALVVFVLGAALLFVPEMTLEQFQTQLRVPEVVQARYLGAALLTLGLMLWFVKDISDERLQKNFSAVGLIGSILAVIVTIISITKGVLSINSWIPIVVEVVFSLGYAFVLFLKPRMKE
jgi:CHASE2 domain-containing sensor protein